MNNIIELIDANKYRLDEINKIRDYFNNEIKERKDIIKKLNKYLVSFKHSFTSYSNKYTSWYYRCFFDFNIYNRNRYK